MKGTRKPGRDKLLRLSIGAGLTLRETTRVLELSEMATLYPKSRRDMITPSYLFRSTARAA